MLTRREHFEEGPMIIICFEEGTMIIYSVLTTLSALALPSVPSSSIVALVMVLASLGIPTSNLSMIFAVEWFL